MAGRSTSRSSPSSRSAPPRTSREATDRNGTSSRPSGRQITSSTRRWSRSVAGSRVRRGLVVGAHELPGRHHQRPVRAGSRSSSHGRPGTSAGSASTSTRSPVQPAERGLVHRSRASPAAEHAPEQVPAQLLQQLLGLGGDRRGGLGGEPARSPPGTSAASPRHRRRRERHVDGRGARRVAGHRRQDRDAVPPRLGKPGPVHDPHHRRIRPRRWSARGSRRRYRPTLLGRLSDRTEWPVQLTPDTYPCPTHHVDLTPQVERALDEQGPPRGVRRRSPFRVPVSAPATARPPRTRLDCTGRYWR